MNKKLSIEEKRNLFDKICRDNHFLQLCGNSTYTEIQDLFVNDMIDLDQLVAEIVTDGSTSKTWDEVKKIVYNTFGEDLPIETTLLPGVKRILETLKELIDTDPQKLLAIATDQLNVEDFIQLISIFKELGIV